MDVCLINLWTMLMSVLHLKSSNDIVARLAYVENVKKKNFIKRENKRKKWFYSLTIYSML